MGDRTLVDTDIRDYGKKGLILDYDERQVKPASYDMRIGEIWRIKKKKWELFDLTREKSYDLRPGESIFVGTFESLRMPEEIAGHVSLKQKWSLQGIAYNSGAIDPTYKGKLWVSLRNVGLSPVTIYEKDPLLSVSFTLLEKKPVTKFSDPDKVYDKWEDLDIEKRPRNPEVVYRSAEEVDRVLNRFSHLDRLVQWINYFMLPVMLLIAATLVVLIYPLVKAILFG